LSFYTAQTERARIDSSGRLLVNTSSDSGNSRLVVAGNVAGPAGGGEITLKRPATVGVSDGVGGVRWFDNNGEFASIYAYGDAATGTNDYPGRLVFSTTADGASSPTERMRIGSAGQFFTFTTSGDAFDVGQGQSAGTSISVFVGRHSSASNSNSGTVSVRIFNNGNIQNTNNSYGSLSDTKLKEKIVDASSQWDDLKALQVRKYNFKKETGHQTHTQIGLIAQEAELVSPGLVSESPDRDEDGNDLGTVTKSVNYSVLYMKAVKALQEAMTRIETLEAANTDLAARLTALEGGTN
jgi:hypothetical protein